MKERLPIDDFLEGIGAALAKSPNIVLTAAPGAGKTTRLPPYLLKHCQKKVVVLEPRRMAAVAATHRIAEENNWQVGSEVGYTVRFANESSAETRLIFMTEALFARKLLEDSELSDIDIIVLDEFHERSLTVDICLGLIRELQELGHPVKLVVMSATLNAAKISQYLGNCPVIDVPGKLFELTIQNQKSHQILATGPDFYENIFQTLKVASTNSQKDILVFLPGVGEIRRTHEKIDSWAQGLGIRIFELHGALDLKSQQEALKKSSQRRIVLATNIAESSVTVDGVDTVIDTGISKQLKQNFKTGFGKLELGRISLNSATQRAGRAARQFAGTCYRLWSKNDELAFQAHDVPEVQRIDLSESLLFLSSQGVQNYQTFSWYEKPSLVSIQSSQLTLKTLSAVDAENRITSVGEKLLRFPLPLRLAKMLLKSLDLRCLQLACDVAAILQEKDFLRKDEIAGWLGADIECDLTPRLEELEKFRKRGTSSPAVVQNILKSSEQLYRLAQGMMSGPDLKNPDNLELLLLHSFTDRLCRRRQKSERAKMLGGRGVKLSDDSLVKKSELFIAIHGIDSAASETQVFYAIGIDKELILKELDSQIERREKLIFDDEKEKFYLASSRWFQDLELDEPSLKNPTSDVIQTQLPQVLKSRFSWLLQKNEDLQHWYERLQILLKHLEGDDSRKSIFDTFNWEQSQEEALNMAALGESSLKDVIEKNLVYFFNSTLPSEMQQLLNTEVPASLKVPSGSLIRIHYPEALPPYIEVRIQEVFGLMETPKLLFKTVPLTFHLLGPNFRPVQVTSNLESFWKNGYPEVRKELRIRYPKHQWPEDPADGTPEAKGRRRH